MLLAILRICSEEELEAITEEDDDTGTVPDIPMSPDLAKRRQQIKNKILAVGKMQRIFQLLRHVSGSSIRDHPSLMSMSCAERNLRMPPNLLRRVTMLDASAEQ